jgi:Kdo2-lipid IVA lauroyltransferase/acyltransferase
MTGRQAQDVSTENSSLSATTSSCDRHSAAVTRTDRLEFLGFRLARSWLAHLPRTRALRVGAALGSLFYRFDRRRGSVARYNLALAFPEKTETEREVILLCSCRNLGRIAAEFCHLDELTPDSVSRYVTPPDPAAWEKVVAVPRERGTVILTAHLGNWELLAYAAGLLGTPVTLVHRAMRNPLVDAEILSMRMRAGTHSIAKKTAAREMLRALHRKEVVAMAADQNQTRRFGVFVQFFGIAASTTPGPARLAMLSGARVYPAFLIREGETERHRIVVLPEVEMVRTGDRETDIVSNTQRCTSVIERMVRQYPEQWIWFHKRWRTRPDGEPKLYR